MSIYYSWLKTCEKTFHNQPNICNFRCTSESSTPPTPGVELPVCCVNFSIYRFMFRRLFQSTFKFQLINPLLMIISILTFVYLSFISPPTSSMHSKASVSYIYWSITFVVSLSICPLLEHTSTGSSKLHISKFISSKGRPRLIRSISNPHTW